MPATRLSEIKAFAPAVEAALGHVFELVGGAPVLPRSEEDAPELRITPQFTLGPATGHRYRRPDGRFDYDLFADCVIEWELSVPRISGAAPATLAATYTLFDQELARIALAMEPYRWAALNARLPYHAVSKIAPAGITTGFDAARAEDRASARYTCWLGIRPTAWPTSAEAYATLTL